MADFLKSIYSNCCINVLNDLTWFLDRVKVGIRSKDAHTSLFYIRSYFNYFYDKKTNQEFLV